MKYKADWPAARQRLTALWQGERLDRPCIAVRASQPVANPTPVPPAADDEAQWLDPAHLTALAQYQIENTWWGGEAIPSHLLMGGWVMSLGGTPRFSPHTIWFETRDVDFTQPSPFRYDPSSPWTQKHEAALLALCKLADRDDFLVGSPCLLPANDLLSMHMSTQAFLVALMDHPEWMAEAILSGARDQLRTGQEINRQVRERHEFWYGNAGWMPFWAPAPYIATQSDVSCMLSPAMFDRFVLPELEVYGQAHNAMWYHLDGGDAKQHLPRLLSLPFLRVIQYVPAPFEPANGPGHLEMYRAIQAAGKIVHIEVPRQNVEPLVRELDPALLMLQTWCDSRAAGEKLLADSVEWARHAPAVGRT